MNRSARLLAVTIFAAMLTASSAYAEMPPQQQGQGPGAGQQDPQAEASRKAEEELVLKDRKAEMLLRLNDHLARIQKAQACVEAATTLEALHGCAPGGGPGGEGMRGGQGGMQQGGGPRGGMQGGPGGQRGD